MTGSTRLSTRLLPLVRGAGPEDRNQTTVLDAALLAFLDFGIKRTSMVEVARRGRLSLATLYRRFAGKSDLIQAVGLWQARQFVEQVDAAVQRQIDRDASAEDQIVELFVAFLDGLRGNKLLDRLLTTEPEVVLPYLTVQGAPVIELGRDYVAEFITRLQTEGKLPQYDPLPLAELVARNALSLALTPQTLIPVDDEAACRQFARDHVVPGFRIP
ncbi:TetR family transcriptional regulator [Nocardia sp. 852002-20019_SCH5090214]|jgi:AcrR family transcriptional regulator|uniref:TetR/AcrR family transcriptional regulator n=1 Tax=Nocardia nova TaxID=37330 RepID=A0A2S5ZZK1_9NOCA|nr:MULTISPECIES: TetR/AcrR family transcriptional regulator [Nocardia]OBF79592.1 TetR family transcriptional regulator [Mycobacterium sp. 852002-51759_SCH5129042]MBF6145313.1 TetR/AcrR family transcriptional regulator [Nocardia nova]MBF6278438.1 TetR/AcrR family transcriptional regulator [Nocardia nova]MBV7704875.1 TetR/AcrR family transcriptional regulator [Nocardia nova]MDN2497756.1 TetR/AcrR family transcriptional regulator [Nocardia nova]